MSVRRAVPVNGHPSYEGAVQSVLDNKEDESEKEL